jgi:hypothetical protein
LDGGSGRFRAVFDMVGRNTETAVTLILDQAPYDTQFTPVMDSAYGALNKGMLAKNIPYIGILFDREFPYVLNTLTAQQKRRLLYAVLIHNRESA